MKGLGLQKNDVVNKWFMEHMPKKEYVKIKASELNIDDAYQRELKQRQVNAIVKEFNWFVVNPPKVVKRSDGKFYVFDGQHTIKAIVKYVNNPDEYIECVVYEGIPYEIENALFSYQTGISRGLTVKDKYKADLQRNCPYALDIKDVLDTLEIPISSGGGMKGVQISEWLINIYNNSGKDGLFDLMKFCKGCFGDRFIGVVVQGVNIVLNEYSEEINRDKLMRMLKSKGSSELHAGAKDLNSRYKCSLDKGVAHMIVEDYTLTYNVDLPRYALK